MELVLFCVVMFLWAIGSVLDPPQDWRDLN